MADHAAIRAEMSNGIFWGRMTWALTAFAVAVAGGYVGHEADSTALGVAIGSVLGFFVGSQLSVMVVHHSLRGRSADDVLQAHGH